uniref:Uncharacterized protein n=1 Tax=Anopheles albimanus TaxID=7167 RepID=A0A2C9GGT7_ANOAL
MKLSLAVLLLSIIAVIAFVEAVPAPEPFAADGTGFCKIFPRLCQTIKEQIRWTNPPLLG